MLPAPGSRSNYAWGNVRLILPHPVTGALEAVEREGEGDVLVVLEGESGRRLTCTSKTSSARAPSRFNRPTSMRLVQTLGEVSTSMAATRSARPC